MSETDGRVGDGRRVGGEGRRKGPGDHIVGVVLVSDEEGQVTRGYQIGFFWSESLRFRSSDGEG